MVGLSCHSPRGELPSRVLMLDGSNSRSCRFEWQTGASLPVPQPRLHPLDSPEAACAAWQMQCRTVRHGATTPLIHPDLSGAPFGPSRLTPRLYPLLTSARRSEGIAPTSVRLPPNTEQISQGKTQNFHCMSARFIKPTPISEGGLRCSVPARPGWTTPHIWFLFVAPQFWNQASFRPHLAVTPLPFS